MTEDTPIATLQKSKTHPLNNCSVYDIKQSNGGVLGKAEYPYIDIAPRSSLARSGSMW